MSFLDPEFLYLMLLPLFVLAYFILSGGASYEKYFSKEVLDKILIKGDKLGTKGRNVLFLSAFVFLIFALARPVSDQKDIKIDNISKNLVIAIDISRSMSVDDIYPTRLEFVKNRLKWLINELPNTNIGLIAFAKDAFLVSPVTNDKSSLEFLLDNLSSDIVSRQGTDVANALHQIDEMFPKGGIKDVFVISDGGEAKDIQKAIDEAKKDDLHVSVMVVGTKKGGVIKTKDGLIKDKSGNIVISKRNDLLLDLSQETNGVYVKEFGRGGGVNLLAKSLKKQKTKDNKKSIKSQKEWFMVPLIMGFLLILIALHGLPKRRALAFILPFLFIAPSYAGVLDFLHVNRADEAIKNKEYQKAIDEYNKLPASSEITYNKANAYYKMKKYDEAIKEYKKVKSKDKNFMSKAIFNEGNSYVKKDKLKEALSSYENALKLNPNDEDIKKNIQYVKDMMKKKKQNKKEQNKKNKDDKKQKNKDKKNNQQNQNKQNKQNSKKDEKNRQNNSNKKQQNQDQNQIKKEKKSEQNKSKDKNKTSMQKGKKMDKPEDLEGKKWEKILRNIHPRTQPVRLGDGDNKGEDDEINW